MDQERLKAAPAEGPEIRDAHLFGAVCPGRGSGAALIMARADSKAMQKHLAEIACAVAEAAHTLVILDQAGWHTSAKLKLPANITLVPLLPASRERKAPETIWQYLRQTYLSSRVFAHMPPSSMRARTPGASSSRKPAAPHPSQPASGSPSVNLNEGWY
jgi:hypothetical protein